MSKSQPPKEIKLLPFHPLASVFPLMEGNEFDDFVRDIQQRTQLEEIDTADGKIIDGRNRARACQKLGIEPRYHERKFNSEAGIRDYIISKNIRRRHLTAEQKRDLIAKLLQADPTKSDRSVAKAAKTHHHAVKKVRKEEERRGNISHVAKRIDSKGRKQPAKKSTSAVKAEQPKPETPPPRSEAPKVAAPALEPNEPVTPTTSTTVQEIKSKPQSPVLQSTSVEHYTPARFIEAARKVLEQIDLDPASCEEANKTVRATKFHDAESDGLTQEWRGRVWLNPPYNGKAAAFVNKLLDGIAKKSVTAAIVCLNTASTDSQWFRPLWNGLLCFFYEPITFGRPGNQSSSPAPHATVLVYFGPRPDAFAEEFQQFGAVVSPQKLIAWRDFGKHNILMHEKNWVEWKTRDSKIYRTWKDLKTRAEGKGAP
jgi:hypothetical protein